MKAFDHPPEFKKSTLSHGVRLLTEHHKYSRSTSMGMFIDLGTRDEPEGLIGIAHFVEHILFKGTKTRNAYDIVKALEAVGGEINAFTSRENTCFHTSTLREDLGLSIDILSDIISNSQFTEDDFRKEREVVLQEIDMSVDQLDEYIFDLYFQKAFQGNNLSHPILGTPESLQALTPENVRHFYRSRYGGPNLIISVAGHVSHQEVLEDIQKRLPHTPPHTSHPFEREATSHRLRPEFHAFKEFIHRPSEQVHTLIGLPSSSYKDNTRFESYIVNALLGGGMTSRLYQKIREQKGLAYSVYSYLHSFSDSGLIMVYTATSEEHVLQVMDLIKQEMTLLKKEGVCQEALDFFKKQVIGNIVLGADDVDNRMNSLAVNEMIFGEYRSVDKVIAEVERVSIESIQKYLEQYFDLDKLGIMLMGPVDKGAQILDQL